MLSYIGLYVPAFVLAIWIVITVHEFGHFWVARRMNIKVLQFSVGLGKAFIKRTGRVDNTEFILASIPLGGYVRLLDERGGEVTEWERDRAFNRQTLWLRSAVVVGGPVASILLSIITFWLVLVIGIPGVAPIIDSPDADSMAERAGLEDQDLILSVDGKETKTWADARRELLSSFESGSGKVEIVAERLDGQRVTGVLPVNYQINSEESSIASLGIKRWRGDRPPEVGRVVRGDAADLAGMKMGDVLLRINGTALRSWEDMAGRVRSGAGAEMKFQVMRNNQLIELSVRPALMISGDQRIGRIGISPPLNLTVNPRSNVIVRQPPAEAFVMAVVQTWDMSVMTIRLLGALITDTAALGNVSGPISIAQYAGESALGGITDYIRFIGLLSLSVAVINMLPVPILDGGHLMYFAAEAVKGKPISENARRILQRFGVVLIGLLMCLAMYNDIWSLIQ